MAGQLFIKYPTDLHLDPPNDGDCTELIERTDEVLESNKPAQKAFVLAQKFNIGSTVKRILQELSGLISGS